MKCTNDRYLMRRRRRKRQLCIRIISTVMVVAALVVLGIYFLNSRNLVSTFENNQYASSIYQTSFFANDLCVANEDIDFDKFKTNDEFHGSLVFDITNKDVIMSDKVHDRLYPASTTKIMTAYLALKYGNLDDTVTVSKNALAVPSDSSKANLRLGDKIPLGQLLYGLMLPSGNDSAVAIAEHISGSVEAFVELMNNEAYQLGATNTHFVNPHGYHSKEHYTTAYDLYLIFNQCIQNETFCDIVSSASKNVTITQADGSQRNVTWNQSNQFINGARKVPKGMTLVGGKTGNTYDAGSCILLYGSDSEGISYITIMMGASSKRNLYDNMTFLLSAIVNR